jgi:hypothetical protein
MIWLPARVSLEHAAIPHIAVDAAYLITCGDRPLREFRYEFSGIP